VMFMANGNFQQREITRTSDTVWTVTKSDTKDGPYDVENKDKAHVMELIVKFGGRVVAFSATNATIAVITIDTNTSATYFRGLKVAEDIFDAGDRVYLDGASGGTWNTLNDKFYRIQNPTTPVNTPPNRGDIELIDEITGVAVDSTGLGTLTAATMVICHADTVADGEDLNGNNFFDPANAHAEFEYLEDEIWVPGMQMSKPSSAQTTGKVQLWSHMAKLDVPESSSITGGSRDFTGSNITASFADTFNKVQDSGKLVRTTDLFINANTVTVAPPQGGHGVWQMLTAFIDGSTFESRRLQNDEWRSDYAAGTVPVFNAFDYESGTDPTKNHIIVKNKQLKGRIKASEATFVSTDVDRWVKLRYQEQVINCKIEVFISTTEVKVDMDRIPNVVQPERQDTSNSELQDTAQTVKKLPFTNNGVTFTWALGVWHDGTTEGVKNWPRLVTFHEGRLVYMHTSDLPQTFWFSESDDFTGFAASDGESVVTDAHAIVRQIAANEVNPIVWVASGVTLLFGTLDREWQIKPSQINQVLTPTNAVIQAQTVIGAEADVRPVVTNNSTFFLQRGGRKLREMTFQFDKDGFVSPDLNSIAEHIIAGGFSTASAVFGDRMAFKPGVVPTFLVVNTLGDVACMTYEPDQKVAAWWLLETANGGDIIEDVVVLPNSTTKDFDIYFIIRRSFGIGVVRYIERLQMQPLSNADHYIDGWIIAPNKFTAAAVAVGLEHLGTENVRVILDGVDDDAVRSISAGQVTITATGQVIVGQTYTSQLETMPVEAGSAEGLAQGKTRRINQIQVLCHESNSYEHSGDGSNFNEDVFGADAVSPGVPAPAVFTGIRTVKPGDGFRHSRDPTIFIRQTRPYPLNILAVTATAKTTK